MRKVYAHVASPQLPLLGPAGRVFRSHTRPCCVYGRVRRLRTGVLLHAAIRVLPVWIPGLPLPPLAASAETNHLVRRVGDGAA